MKPFRNNLAIAIDGGGIKGVVITKALSILEEHLGMPLHQITRLTAGTSTGAIISAGLAAGLTSPRLFELYNAFGKSIFRKSWRTPFNALLPFFNGR
jgi:patatin-like phospholipase/acyl hydrolase